MAQKQNISSENILPVKKIEGDSVFLKDGGLRKVIMVNGVNFDLKSEEEQQMILSAFADLLNSLDYPIEISVSSRKFFIDDYLNRLKEKENQEQNEMMRSQIAIYREFIENFVAENAVMKKGFFITIPHEIISLPTIGRQQPPAETEPTAVREAKEKLDLKASQIINSLHRIGLRGIVLEEAELRELFYSAFNPGEKLNPAEAQKFIGPRRFEIAPDSLKVDELTAKSLFLSGYPRYLSSGWLSGLINLAELADISIHISPTETGDVLRQLRNRSAQVQVQLMEIEEKGLVRDPMLETALQDIEALRDNLQQSQEKLFSVSVYLTIFGKDSSDLNRIIDRISSGLEAKLIYAKPLLFENLQGFYSTLPIAEDRLEIANPFNTNTLSSFFPFVSATLSSDEGILYGINRHNNTPIIFDRFSLENANTVVFAKAGSGKSYATKLEVLRSLMIGDEVIIIDPENEYENLANSAGGSFIKISLDSPNHINPFDVPQIPEDESPPEVLKSHIVNLTSLLKLMFGEIKPEEEAVIDQAITEAYASKDITPNKDFSGATPPLLEDLEEILRNIEGGRALADRLYRFTKGSYAGFLNQASNIDTNNRLIVFSIRDLEDELRPIAMFIILNFVWNLVRADLKKRLMIIDEAWWMMKYPDSASFLFGLVKRARKYYLGISTITQDVEDFLSSPYGRPIITNSSLQLLLKQSPSSIESTGKAFGLSESEKNYLLEVDIGQGLFLAGLTHAAIEVVASPFEHQIITTNPEEIVEAEQAEAALAGEEGLEEQENV
ncbi:MAG: ATP-binding protein [Patescibacteria group bacterium]|nr:ATP-binding protein [Patescibacteria group bacterium]MCL5262158.1 ATP-binding protein [Patescibacteria group bacterium]